MRLRLLVLTLAGVGILLIPSGPGSIGQVPPFPADFALYRGNLHSHSDYSGDLPIGFRGLSSPLQVYDYARSMGWDFWAITDHTGQPCPPAYGPTLRLDNARWATLRSTALSATVNGAFVALAGFEWTGTDTRREADGDCDSDQFGVLGVGHMNVIEPNAETVQGANYSAARLLSENEIYGYLRSLLPRAGARILQFNHPDIYPRTTKFTGFRMGPDLQDINNGFTALMELGTGWYSRGPVARNLRGLAYNNRAEDEFRDALVNGWFVGATNNQDSHFYDLLVGSPPNHTGVWATALTRAAILDAIQARRVFASEDRTFELWFTANDAPMGAMGANCVPNRGGNIEFRIRLRDAEPSDTVITAAIVGGRVDYRRSVRVKASLRRPAYGDNLRMVIPYEANSFYYLRIEQADNDLIFSSPVWTCAATPPTPTPTPAPTPTPSGGPSVIYIADQGNGRIVRINNMSGTGWTTFNPYPTFLPGSQAHMEVNIGADNRIYAVSAYGVVWRMDNFSGAGFVSFGTPNCFSPNVGTFCEPTGMALDASNRIYIANQGSPGTAAGHRIIRMDDMAGSGWVTCCNLYPNFSLYLVHDVFVSGNGQIYAGAYRAGYGLVRIDDMTGSGWIFCCTGQEFYVTKVFVHSDGRIYVTDALGDRIIRIDSMSGAGWVTFGTRGSGVGQFDDPDGIFVAADGRIYVADTNNNRIVRIDDMSGNGWTTFGSAGNGVNQFFGPRGLYLVR
jgi:outer membrane protein assembly factor BamB